MRLDTRNTLEKLKPTYWENTDGDIYRFQCECGQKTVFAMPREESEIEFNCMGCDKDVKLINTENLHK